MHATSPKPSKTVALVISLLIPLAIGITASMVTRPQIAGWYAALHKPAFNPPNWLFGPVWTIIYILMGIAAWLVWQKRSSSQLYSSAMFIYVVQLVLNFSWSMVFFGLHQIAGALAVITLLWMSIGIAIYYFSKFSRVAGWLLVPYLLWVSYASALNLYIYLLNR
ncbi:tryptophan-rich sensory protein [Mucilaginibacter robiniae]|uniref:Tryptophan-rich sensory protein n=1 Tax=Mucilaginibacter robiniae TaxID=2728022 RepID=A0A7L5DYG2_9SPHI|nr:TspO/MBR family protein [Mucilaginibacter robiniae]QJD95147.1 tryptophan-rich sensory protein [Mucilaginibacter robiniae]